MKAPRPPSRRLTRHEKRRNVELEHARGAWMVDEGLEIVHRLKDCDAELKWLAELFPLEVLEAHFVPREVAVSRLREWCALHPEDMRALAHLARVLKDQSLFEKAALSGDAMAMGMCAYTFSAPTDRQFQFACSASQKGDSMGAFFLALFVRKCMGGSDVDRSEFLLRAADLGSHRAFNALLVAQLHPSERLKLLTSFFLVSSFDVDVYEAGVREALRSYAEDRSSCADAIFGAGELLKGVLDPVAGRVLGRERAPGQVEILRRAVSMYDCWCDIAREACKAWIIVAKRMNFDKDVRRMITRMVWEARDEAKGNLRL